MKNSLQMHFPAIDSASFLQGLIKIQIIFFTAQTSAEYILL